LQFLPDPRLYIAAAAALPGFHPEIEPGQREDSDKISS
jgi:hypothetical protein